MRKLIFILILLLLTSCASTQKNIWVRTDGQPMVQNAALEQQYLIDAEICKGEAQRANLSAGTNYYSGLVANIAEDMRRNNVIVDVAKGCMAGRGYMFVPEAQAAEMSRAFAATRRERGMAPLAAAPRGDGGGEARPRSTARLDSSLQSEGSSLLGPPVR